MNYIKISRENMGNYVQPFAKIANVVDAEFDGAEIGDTIQLELIEMTEEEYQRLPEFQGW